MGRLAVRRFALLFFLEAFNIAGTIDNVLIVMSVESVSKALPFTPGERPAAGAAGRDAAGPSLAAVLSFSVGQQIAVAAWAVLLGFLSLAVVFGSPTGAAAARGLRRG